MGTTITIRRVTTKDAAALAQLMSDPAVYGGTLQLPCPNEEMRQARLAGNADNEVAQRLDRKFGFEVEDRFSFHALRDGVYVDSISIARFHPNPPGMAAAPTGG